MAETVLNTNQLTNKVLTADNLHTGEGLSLTTTKTHTNYTVVGSPTISDGVASGFSDDDYLSCENYLNNSSSSFEVVTAVKMTTASSSVGIFDTSGVSTHNIRLTTSTTNTVRLRISTDGSETYAVDITGTTPLTVGTKFYIKATYNSSTGYALYTSTDGSTWTTEGISSVTTRPYSSAINSIIIGDNAATGYSLTGSIYLSDSYINVNGSRVWTAYYTEDYNELSAPGVYAHNNLIAGNNISITQVEKPVIDSNTVELLHFNDDALDSISNNILSTSSYLLYSNGKFGKAGSNSTNHTAQFTAPVSFTKGNSYYTIDCWISSNASGNYNRILRLIFSSAMDCINFGTNSVEIFRMFNNGSQDVTVNYPNNITLDVGVWHHFALVGNGNQTLMFFDGKLFYSTFYTAGNESIAFYGFSGRMDVDELRVSNIARWTSDFTPYTEPYGPAGATQYQINNTQDISSKQDALTTATGYDATKTQVLKNVNGTLTWVDEA